MSKIPQGEWSAIAARYAKGESISRIAQTYGCTPPAIHYILKRSKQRSAESSEERVNGKPDLAASLAAIPKKAPPSEAPRAPVPEDRDTAERRIEENGVRRSAPGEVRPPVQVPSERQPAREAVTPQTCQRAEPAAVERAGGRPSAFTAGLDRDLHGRAEAAIAAFRSSFDAALAESSPDVRERLRQAASDLMRVAARTTIVLDRLNANAERVASRTPDDRFALARPPSWSGAGRSVQEGSPDGATQKAASC
jgi:transposase-like protein